MHAQILVDGEMHDLAGRVTDEVVTVLADLAAGLTDPQLRSAMGALVAGARQQLAAAPVDPEPLVRAILRGDPATPAIDPFAAPTPIEAPSAARPDAPAYWPAVPAISDELFAQYAASRAKEQDEHLAHSPAGSPEPGADHQPDPATADPESGHGGRFNGRALRRKKSRRQ